MRISRLIKELQESKRQHGDIDVIFAVDTENSTEDNAEVNEYEIDSEICIGYDSVKKEYSLILQADRSK